MNWFQKILCKLFHIGCPQTPPPPPSNLPAPSVLYGYFAGGVVPEFAAHTNVLFIGSWGDWVTPAGRQTILANYLSQMQAAINNGITRVIIVTDWCTFTPQYAPLDAATATSQLRQFFDAIEQAGFMSLVSVIYPLDEPDNLPLSDTQVTMVNDLIRTVMAEYPTLHAKLATTYGDRAGKGGPLPGVLSFDWVGFDNYGSPIFTNGEYNSFVSRIGANQRTLILPGGCDPWKQDPTPFYNHAQTDPRVAMIMPFMWFENGGTPGIVNNGMAPVYIDIGTKIKAVLP